MKIEKSKLTKVISKLKTVVPKITGSIVLQGILVKDGYFIANSMEMAVRTKIEGSEGENFIIPLKAFEFIASLPDGEVELIPGEKDGAYFVTIKTEKIINKYQSFDPEEFTIPNLLEEDEGTFTVEAEQLLTSMKRVIYSVPQENRQMMGCMSFKTDSQALNIAGLDGRVAAWDKIFTEGNLDILVPGVLIDKLLSIGLSGKCTIKHNKNGVIFSTPDCEIFARIMTGEYYDYKKVFAQSTAVITTVIDRQVLLDAMVRAKMNTDDHKAVRMEFKQGELKISARQNTTDYNETIELDGEISTEIVAGYDPRIAIETLKSFDCDMVALNLTDDRIPMVIEADNSEFMAVIAPIAIKKD